MEKRQIVCNRIRCECCHKELVSYHRHDFKTCGCENHTYVDGGLSYLRFGGVDAARIRSLAVYLDEGHERVRVSFHWGTRGKKRDKLRWVPLAQMRDDHIRALLHHRGAGLAGWISELMETELAYRYPKGQPPWVRTEQ